MSLYKCQFAMMSLVLWLSPMLSNANVSVTVSDCSGVVFIMPGMSADQKAMVLTNGHCIGIGGYMNRYPDDGEVFVNREVTNSLILMRNKYDSGEFFGYSKVLFATLTGVDLAVIELDATYEELRSGGYTVYKLATELPEKGMILNFDSYNRNANSSCEVEKTVPILREDRWTWSNFIRMVLSRTCHYVHGQSGTAGIDPSTGLIYALAQTVYEGGAACTLNNPCEVDPLTGAYSTAGIYQSYAVPVVALHDCYDVKNKKFDFRLNTCGINFRK